MEHFGQVTEITLAHPNHSNFAKSKDISSYSAFVAQYTSNHNWLAVIDDQYINDNFNLYGIQDSIPNFPITLKVLRGEINLESNKNNADSKKENDNKDVTNLEADRKSTSLNKIDNNSNDITELPENIEQNCINAYNLIHSRYIQSPKGLQIMRRKYEAGIFGTCPRFLCNGQNLLPFGSSMKVSKAPARGYCPLCHDIYEADVLIDEQLENKKKKDNDIKKEKSLNEEYQTTNTNEQNTQITKSETNDKINNKNNSRNSKNLESNSTENDSSDANDNQNQTESNNTNDNNTNSSNDENNEKNNKNEEKSFENKENNDNAIQNEIKILDGCSFGPFFPHIFLQMNRDLIPAPMKSPEAIESQKFPDFGQKPSPAPLAKPEQMKYTIFGIPIEPDSDLNPHRVVRDPSIFNQS